MVSLTLSEPGGGIGLRQESLSAGEHRLEMREGEIRLDGATMGAMPSGRVKWALYSHATFNPTPRGWIGQPGVKENPKGWPAPDGEPSAVACDQTSVFLGSSAGTGSGAVVAIDPEGQTRWSHQREGHGVHALSCEQNVLFVLADRKDDPGGSLLYKLDATNGNPVGWGEGANLDLMIQTLWPAEGAKPGSADAMTVGNGRIYLSFTKPGFIAVLDARDGRYVTTLSGPGPGQMAVSTTPMREEDGREKVADFGVAVLGQSAVSYFVMPHDPPWVAFNTTHWLPEDEKVTAFTMLADTMKSGEIDLYLALGAPYCQVQRKQVVDPRGFTLTAGRNGGRSAPLGPWEPDALRTVRSLAIDALGRLWVAEGENCPKRFTFWSAKGSIAELKGELFPPVGEALRGATLYPGDPAVVIAAGCEWKLGAGEEPAACVGVITQEPMKEAGFITANGRHLLVVCNPAAVTFYERELPGKWRLLASIEMQSAGQAVYWTDTDDDGARHASELQTIPGKNRSLPIARPNGLLDGEGNFYPINGWTSGGAPLFDWEHPVPPPLADPIHALFPIPEADRSTLMRSADGRAFFIARASGLHVMEIDGARSLQKRGEGEWLNRAQSDSSAN